MDEHIQKIIEETISEKNFKKIRENSLFLSDRQIEVLERNHVDWKRCMNMKELLFLIEEALYEVEDEQLDLLAGQLQEQDYYSNSNK